MKNINKKSTAESDGHIVSEIDRKPIRKKTCSIKCFLIIIGSIFFSELFVMFLLSYISISSPVLEASVDSFILSLIVAPIIYFFLMVPVKNYIAQYQDMEYDLRDLSFTDQLTGIYNRRGFKSIVEHRLLVALREKKKELLIFIDIDNFKKINDTYGHEEGELVLVKLSAIIKRTFRNSDIVGRLGGDEFVVYLVDFEKGEDSKIISKLDRNLNRYNKTAGKEYEIQVSIGAAHFDPGKPDSIDELLNTADREMYKKKKENKRKAAKEKSWCPM